MTSHTQTVLIAGASGLVGSAAALAFMNAGWDVIAVCRHRPELLKGRRYQHVPLDLRDAAACRSAAGQLAGVTHVVYAAVHELPGLVAGWTDPMQIETNGAMLKNLMQPLAETAVLEHVTILQGTKAYGGHVKPMRIPPRTSL